MIDCDFDASNYWGLIQAMRPSERMKVMRGSLRSTARTLKRRAEDILLSRLGHVRNRAAMRRTIWTKVYDRTAGFRVTVAGNAHCYPARQRELPLARWLEEGTAERRTSKFRGSYLRLRRGQLRPVKFLAEANSQMEGRISAELSDKLIQETHKIAKRYGCV